MDSITITDNGPNAPTGGAPTSAKDGLPAITDGLDLSQEAIVAAQMEAFGFPITDIERTVGLLPGAVISMRSDARYRELVERFLTVRARNIVNNAPDVETLFNDEIRPSVAALIEVRDNRFSRGGDRIKAAVEFLNRAPKAPKVQQVQQAPRTVIVLPARDFGLMKQALLEEGTPDDAETLELLRGRDFSDANSDVAIALRDDPIVDVVDG